MAYYIPIAISCQALAKLVGLAGSATGWLRSNAQAVILENVGHLPMVEKPAESAMAFLALSGVR